MRSKHLLLVACAAGVSLSIPACGDAPPVAGPNVLLVSIDTLRADHLGFHGYERPTSPELDAFAETAVVFDGAQAAASWTLPGMASVLTSTYTSTHLCWTLGSRLDESFLTLTESLLAHGWDTACVVSHLFCTTRHGLQQGFVHFDDTYAYPEIDPEDAVTSEVISDRGIEFIERKAEVADGRPWFLWLHYFDPHETYVEQPGFTERFGAPDEPSALQRQIDLYDGEIAYTDHHVGRVLDALEARGLAEDTIVVLVSDHGEEFQDHGGIRHGHALYGELIRVPFVIRAPGIAPRRVADVVRTVDLMPTVLDLAGLPVPHQAVGRSLRDALEGAALPSALALSEIGMNDALVLDAIVDGRMKLIRRLSEEGRLELYDLEADPLEREDLAASDPEEAARLERALDRLKLEATRKAGDFDVSPASDLSPTALEHLSALGYTGDEPGEEEQ
jgi:arylsulfatase A-like enzyme